MNITDICNHLKIEPSIATGLARAGFFGYSSESGIYDQQAIIDFERYGAQWNKNLEKRLLPDGIEPVVAGWENPPPYTPAEYCISIDNSSDTTNDTHWIANFFFMPNDFYFPESGNYSWPPENFIELNKKFTVQNSSETITIYPDPCNRLALIQIFGTFDITKKSDAHLKLIEAKNKITPILNWIALQANSAIPIVQQNLIGIPSGNINYISKKHAPKISLNPQNFTEHLPLREAQSLYRLGLNCNEPMYAFLSFWRANEAMDIIQDEHLKSYKIKFNSHENLMEAMKEYGQLRTPSHPAFGEFSGLKISKNATTLRDKYRNAIAHSKTDKPINITLTGSDEASQQKMQAALATLHQLVKTKLDKLNKILQLAKDISTFHITK